jgi:hypothetical protein
MKNIFTPIQTYTVLTQDTSTIFINQVKTSHAPRQAHCAGIRISNNLRSHLKILMHEEARFKIALK